MVLQLERSLSKQENRDFSPIAALSGRNVELTFPHYTIKAAHLPIKVITGEILLITGCIRTRLTFTFQITQLHSIVADWEYHNTGADEITT